MKKLFLYIPFFIITGLSSAQTPKFEWAKNTNSSVRSLGLDELGNTYTAGHFNGTVDFDPGAGIFTLSSSGQFGDSYILKLNPSGNFVWAKKIGGPIWTFLNSMFVSKNGSLLLIGAFEGEVDFDPGVGEFKLTSLGDIHYGGDIFILKINSNGDFIWVSNLGAEYDDQGKSIWQDKEDNIYITGTFHGKVDFDPDMVKTYYLEANNKNTFIVKWDSAKNFKWAKCLIGSTNNEPSSIITDNLNNVYITGDFESWVDFDPGINEQKIMTIGDFDSFILKLDNIGNFKWVKIIGGKKGENSAQIVIDKTGSIYCTGRFSETVDFDSGLGEYNLKAIGEYDIFILKIDTSGKFLWAKKLGGASFDGGSSMSIDPSNFLYLTGGFSDTVGYNSVSMSYFYSSDIFVSKLDSSGKSIWETKIGGRQNDGGVSIMTDKYYNVYITGGFGDTVDFNPSNEVFNLMAKNPETFIFKMSQNIAQILSVQNKKLINIYPNPVNTILNIELQQLENSKINIQLLNSIGQIVTEETSPDQHSTLNIQHLPAGLYLVKVKSDNNIIATQKIVKQ